MCEPKKTEKALIEELETLRRRVAELERIEAEHKRVEEALRESEERYAKAEQISHFSHWERNFVEDKATWSKESYRIFGVDPGQFEPSYENFLNLVHPSDKDRVENTFMNAISHGKPFDVEYRIVRPDGTERVLHSVAEVRFDKSGRPVKLVGTAHDVTERKRAEDTVQKAHDKLEARVQERTAALSKANALLKKQVAEREQTEENILRLNQCFLEFGPATDKNIGAIVETAGVILGGICALYNRLEGDLLCSVGEWQAPSDMPKVDKAKGHLCYDVITGGQEPLIVRNLDKSPYAESDPNVKKYNLKTYIGHVVEVQNKPVGSLCVVHKEDRVLKPPEIEMLSILARALGIEEERRNAESVLRESEEKYRSVVENIGIGVSLISPKMEILALNKQLRELFPKIDVSKKPICYKTFNRPPREDICSYCPTCKSLKDGQVHESITETPAGDKIVNYRIVSSPIKNKDGKVIAAIEMVEDITEWKKAEEALRESEERHRALFEGAADGILVADSETLEFKYANPTICKMLGYSKEELTRMGVRDIHPKEDLEHVISEFNAQARREKTLAPNIPCLRKDGTTIYADINTTLAVIDGVECNVGFFTDITEHKQAEKELLFKSTLLEAQSETSIDGILVVDGEGKSLLFNKRFGQMWNIPEEILGTRDDKKMLRCVLGQLKDPDQFLEKVKYLYAHKSEKSRDEIRFKDGRVFDRYSSTLLDSNGRHYGRIWYFRDITERKQAVEALQKARDGLEDRVEERTAELAQAGEKLRALAAELSLAEARTRRRIADSVHDHVSQNLAISKIRLESLRESVSSPELIRSLNEIGELIAQTIENARSLTSELSPPQLYQLGFEAAVEWLVRHTKQQYGLAAEFKDDGRAKPLSNDVRVLLFEAVRELLVNVVKHAKARNVTVSARRVSNEIRVDVEDDGVGFSASQISSRYYKDGGFGLFSIRERLDHIGGCLRIESKLGVGSRLTLVAPIDHVDKGSKEKRK